MVITRERRRICGPPVYLWRCRRSPMAYLAGTRSAAFGRGAPTPLSMAGVGWTLWIRGAI